jgi:hypothetical protein
MEFTEHCKNFGVALDGILMGDGSWEERKHKLIEQVLVTDILELCGWFNEEMNDEGDDPYAE